MIEVGEYVRIKNGRIRKVKSTVAQYYITDRLNINEDNQYTIENITKHSKNIIDLIEVGDYVKSKDGIEGKVDFVMLPLKIFVNGEEVLNGDIKSIVTKEQFKNIEYIVED